MPKAPGKEVSPAEKEKDDLSARDFSGTIMRDWQVVSFSSLTAGLKESAGSFSYASMDLPDHDQMEKVVEEP
jgi:hypothetical protein